VAGPRDGRFEWIAHQGLLRVGLREHGALSDLRLPTESIRLEIAVANTIEISIAIADGVDIAVIFSIWQTGAESSGGVPAFGCHADVFRVGTWSVGEDPKIKGDRCTDKLCEQ
jgi:hypothetical protein